MSVQYNKQLKKYVTLYGDQFNNIVMRTSDTPQGTWSTAKVLMEQQPGGIYAPMMHPWSPSTMGTGTDLYWNLSVVGLQRDADADRPDQGLSNAPHLGAGSAAFALMLLLGQQAAHLIGTAVGYAMPT